MSNIFLEACKTNESKTSLNQTNDLTRLAYSNQNLDIPTKNNSRTDRFEENTFINHKESFEKNNVRINELNNEISELKMKLKIIDEKDEEIYILNNELSECKSSIKEYEKYKSSNIILESENESLKKELNSFKDKDLNCEGLKSENLLLKKKLLEFINSKTIKEETINEDKKDNDDDIISIDIEKIKDILYKKLKDCHENHINNLLLQYGLNEKKEIKKEQMEKLLIEAIHL